ncbi:hypothetical protein EI555_009007, partial [Monodon monoceros]
LAGPRAGSQARSAASTAAVGPQRGRAPRGQAARLLGAHGAQLHLGQVLLLRHVAPGRRRLGCLPGARRRGPRKESNAHLDGKAGAMGGVRAAPTASRRGTRCRHGPEGPRPGPRKGGAGCALTSDLSSSLGLVLRKWKTVSQAVSDTRCCPPAARLRGISRSRCAKMGVGVAVGALGLQKSHTGQKGPLSSLPSVSLSLSLSSCFHSAMCWMRQVGLQGGRLCVGGVPRAVNTLPTMRATLIPSICCRPLGPSFLQRGRVKDPYASPESREFGEGEGSWMRTPVPLPLTEQPSGQRPLLLPSLLGVGGVLFPLIPDPSPRMLVTPLPHPESHLPIPGRAQHESIMRPFRSIRVFLRSNLGTVKLVPDLLLRWAPERSRANEILSVKVKPKAR